MINSRNAQGEPWYKWVKRWGQTNLTEDDPARNNIDFWRSQWKRTRVQGVIVNCGERRGLLLPDLDGVDTVEEQIDIARKKGGIGKDEDYTLQRFEVIRHF